MYSPTKIIFGSLILFHSTFSLSVGNATSWNYPKVKKTIKVQPVTVSTDDISRLLYIGNQVLYGVSIKLNTLKED
jgi:hypothetical protein